MGRFKRGLKTALCLLPFGLVGGYFTGFYAFAGYGAAIQGEILAQLGSVGMLALVSAAQGGVYAFVCGLFGRMLAEKCGLWSEDGWKKEPLKITLRLSLLGGVLFYVSDRWFFALRIPAVLESYAGKPDVYTWLSSLLYGGVVEETMLRLFVMSLLAWLGWKLFAGKAETAPKGAVIAANLVSALLFAAGHLPVTIETIGVTPLILLRCFLLNGSFGILFGALYRRYGIRYAMVSHGMFHFVSKLLWTLIG